MGQVIIMKMELKHTWGNVHPQVLFLLSVLNEVVSCCEVEQVKMQILTDNGHQLHRRVPQTFSLYRLLFQAQNNRFAPADK